MKTTEDYEAEAVSPVHIAKTDDGLTYCGEEGIAITLDEAENSADEGKLKICRACLHVVDDIAASLEDVGYLDIGKAKEVIDDLNSLDDKLGKIVRRFGNTKEQTNAVTSVLKLLAGIKELKADPDLPVQFSFRATFSICEHQALDATIGTLTLPISVLADELLPPIAAAGLRGLEIMREEIDEVTEVMADATIDYEAYARKANDEDVN